MTNEEALIILNAIRMGYICDPNECTLSGYDKNELACRSCDEGHEALAIAINAVKKQIPKKPNKAVDRSWGIEKEVPVCPTCDYYLPPYHFIKADGCHDGSKVTYCEVCSQAISWRDEDDK